MYSWSGTVSSIVQAFWGGQLNLPKQSMEDFRLDACRSQIIKTLLDDFVVHALLDLVFLPCSDFMLHWLLLASLMLNDFLHFCTEMQHVQRDVLIRSALMVVVDRRRSGSFTLGEFTEFLQTLVEVAKTYDSHRFSEMTQGFSMNDVSDSLFTFLRDLRYAIYVLKKRIKGKMSLLEQAMLK